MKKLNLKIAGAVIITILTQLTHAYGATLEAVPNVIHIGAFYNGATVTLSGLIPQSTDAILRVTGDEEEIHLKKKGKVAGLLWMNTGDVTLENAVRVDMIYLPESIKDIEKSAARSFGLEALKDRISIIPLSENKHFIIGEFIKLKMRDGLYTVNPDTVAYGPVSKGMKPFNVTASIPPGMKPGTYSVELEVLQDNTIVEELSATFMINLVGFPAQLSKLAYKNSLLYGVLAVIIALAAGLFIGVVFKNRGGAH